MQEIAYSYLGLKPNEFWSLTLKEWDLMLKGYQKKKEEDVEIVDTFVTKLAFKTEYAHRMKRLEYKKLEDRKPKHVEGEAMSVEDHKAYMEELEKEFNKK